jgi:hypothetical protein
MWDLLLGILLIPFELCGRRQQAKAARRRAASIAGREAQGYRHVCLPSRDTIASLMYGAMEDWFVPGELAEAFEVARNQALANYNQLTDKAWNDYAAGELSSGAYRRICEIAQHAYKRHGESVERAQVASGATSPESARFAREHFYDYQFPYVLEPPMLGGSSSSASRPSTTTRSQERPMRDVTPPKPQVGSRRTFH